MSGERIHAQQHPAPDAFALMQGEGGDQADDERHREFTADVERHRPAQATAGVFASVRDLAVAIGSAATQLDLVTIDAALVEAERAQTLGPILDPTAFMRGSDALSDQVAYLRAFRTFRAAIDPAKRLVYATDACEFWQHNVRSIALGLEALRAVDRYGISRRGEQYAGFRAALTPGRS